MEVKSEWSQGIWKAKRQVTHIHIKENSENTWPFAHILMYASLRVISACIREKGFKSCIHKIMSVFRDDLRNIKGTKMVHGVQRVCRGTGKAINVWSTMCGKISYNRCPLMCEVKGVIRWPKYIIIPSQKWSDEEPSGRTSHATI